MKELSDKELKKASILTFTDNIELIRNAMDNEYLDIKDTGFWNNTDKILSLFAFAEYTNDKKLLEKLRKLFKSEMDAIFNE